MALFLLLLLVDIDENDAGEWAFQYDLSIFINLPMDLAALLGYTSYSVQELVDMWAAADAATRASLRDAWNAANLKDSTNAEEVIFDYLDY